MYDKNVLFAIVELLSKGKVYTTTLKFNKKKI